MHLNGAFRCNSVLGVQSVGVITDVLHLLAKIFKMGEGRSARGSLQAPPDFIFKGNYLERKYNNRTAKIQTIASTTTSSSMV